MDHLKQYRLNGELYAWISLTEEELSMIVPSQFPKSKDRNWKDYSTITTTPNGYHFILVGERDSNGNRQVCISDEEFELWKKYFSDREIWCYSEAMEYMKQFENNDI